MIRIGINPGSLSRGENNNKVIMDKITVVGCAFGQCKFTKPNYGLGFYEMIVTPKIANNFKRLVIACSKQGCIKKSIIISSPNP